MKILSLGYEFDHDHPSIEESTFRSGDSLFDFDVILWNPNNLIWEYSAKEYRGCKSLDDNDSVRLMEDVKRVKTEMAEMLKMGRTIIIFTPEPEKYYIDTGRREYSGTGRNRRTTRIVDDIELTDFLPIGNLKTIGASGFQLEFRGKEPFDLFWRTNNKYFSYRAYFEKPIGVPLFYIKDTQKVIGSFINVEKGNLIFIPNFLDDVEIGDNEDYSQIGNRFIDSIIELVNNLNKSTGGFRPSAWCSNYLLPGELKEKEKLKKLESKLGTIKDKISTQKKSIAELGEYKILFSGDGRALEILVGRIFSELGFDVAEGLPGRDDLILKYAQNIAVVEVKGVSKSAGEKHAAQLEKWVSEYHSQKDIKPKGILVINTYKDIPLLERNELSFPDQMIPYSINREHCLITGVQLLGLYMDCRFDLAKREKMVNLIFKTNGIFPEYKDWSNFLENRETIQKENE